MAENDIDPPIEPVEPIAADPAPAPEPVVEADPHPAPTIVADQAPDWALERINSEGARATQAEKRAQTAEEMLARIQRGDKPAEADPTAQKPPIDPNSEQFTRAVNEAAQRQRFLEDTQSILAAGMSSFQDFQKTLQILAAANVTNDDCIADIIEVVGKENTHVMLDKLGKDQTKAAALAKMTPRARIVQLTRMTMPEQKPADPVPAPAPTPRQTVSRAPAPRPAIDPSAPVSNDNWMKDGVADEDFYAGLRASPLGKLFGVV